MTAPNLQPTLTGSLVRLRPVREDDWHGMFAAAANPEIWADHPVAGRHTEAGFRAFFDGALSSGSAFSIIDKKSGAIIGSSRYHGFDPVKSEIEIGWTFLARRYWGGVYNREIKQLMLDHAFGFVKTVVFWIGEENIRSRRAVEKIGGVARDGLHVKRIDGNDYVHVIYEICARDLLHIKLEEFDK